MKKEFLDGQNKLEDHELGPNNPKKLKPENDPLEQEDDLLDDPG